MIELYAITHHPAPPLPPGLRAVEDDGLALVCAEADEPLEPSVDLLWQHEGVVEALMEDRDLLPVRYGTRLDGDAAAVQVLRERRGQLASALERVRGAVELSVRVVGERREQPARPEGESGTDYMRAKAGIAAAESATIDAIHEPLASLARDGVRRPASAPGELLRAAYLVDRERVSDFTKLLTELERRHPDLRLLCTGPWPPYSFSES